MKQVCQGLKTSQTMISETLEEYKEMFVKTREGFHVLEEVSSFFSSSFLSFLVYSLFLFLLVKEEEAITNFLFSRGLNYRVWKEE